MSNRLWLTLKTLAAKSGTKWAAVAYVTSDEVVQFEEGDKLVVDATDTAVSKRMTDALVLKRAFERGAELYSLPGLHSKIMVLSGHAIIGSANLSTNSPENLIEAALVTDQTTIVGMSIALINDLAEAAELIDDEFISRITSIVVEPSTRGVSKRKKSIRTGEGQVQSWLVGIGELEREFPDEAEDVAIGQEIAERKKSKRSSDVNWLRFTGTSRFTREAKVGDNVIQVWTAIGKKSPCVYKSTLILHKQSEPKCTRFFVEEPVDSEGTTLSWKGFLQLAKRVGIPGKIGRTPQRLLKDIHADALHALWCPCGKAA